MSWEGSWPVAEKVTVALVDDLDGSEAVETVEFGLDGVYYAIDLNSEHGEALREELEPYTQHGKRLGRRKKKLQAPRKAAANGNATRQPASSVSNREQNQAIRTWAKAAGYEVSDRGCIPAGIVEAYNTAR